jgi:ABC-type branched-subunit amino acid transport system substrate-binding protein
VIIYLGGPSRPPNSVSRFYIVSTRIIAFIVALAAMALLAGSGAASGELSDQEKRGKLIYLKGESSAGNIVALLGSSDLELPAASFPCANCHGLRGEGTKEGGLQPPPLTWGALTTPQRSSVTNRDRAAYNETTLARAIAEGRGPDGAKLHPGMPLYKMNAAQMADLIAYLRKLGSAADAEPGLGDDYIKVGAALPVSGPLVQIGEDVKLALEAYFKEINSQGGVYNRRIELVVEDSKGDAAGTLEATRRLIERQGVFALVGSFEPSGSAPINEFLSQSQVPLVGPVTLSPRMPSVPNRYVFYFLPSFGDQARSLVDFIASKNDRPSSVKLGVVHTDSDFDLDALAGLQSQAKLHGMEVVAEQAYGGQKFSAETAVRALMAKKPDYVFFFGGADDFKAFAEQAERQRLEAGLVSSTVMIGRGAFALSSAMAKKTFLAYPASLPNASDFKEFITVMQKAGAEIRSPAFQSVAFAAAKVFVEATKASSRNLSRAGLVNSLEQLRNFNTGVLPPITFGPNRRVGAAGSYIVGIDIDNKQYAPLSERIIPKQ